MVCGIAWVSGIGSVLAIIFGHIALRQLKTDEKAGKNFAIAGVVLGWVGLALAVTGLTLTLTGHGG